MSILTWKNSAEDDHCSGYLYTIRYFLSRSPIWTISKTALANAYNEGNLVICAPVVSELASLFTNEDLLKSALDKLYIELKPISFKAASFAGFLWRQYKKSGGKHKRIITDFLIASHALDTADCLLTRDRGFYRRYFKNLKIVQP